MDELTQSRIKFVEQARAGGRPNTLQQWAYFDEYTIMLNWFRSQRGQWCENTVRLGGLMIYGWMPTILRMYGTGESVTHPGELMLLRAVVNQLNAEVPEDFKHLDFLNRSYVGTSKFLHFCWPNYFAIWDRNVHAALEWPGVTNSTTKFIRYQSNMRHYCGQDEKRMREVEFHLFQQGYEDIKKRNSSAEVE